MSQNPHAADLSKAERIDALCDEFEALWQKAEEVRLEDWLLKAGDLPRLDLFRALLAVEVELRLKAREKVTTGDYEGRFPEWKEAIREVFREIQQTRRENRAKTKTVAGTVSTSSPTAETSIAETAAGPFRETAELPPSLARFQILEVLGAGAFGTVYKARDPKLARDVAIKVPKESMLKTADDRERFLREARAAANLSHPNICPVHEVSEIDGREYIVMGFIPGKSLSALIPTGKIQARQAAFCTYKLAKAFQEAHENGVLHRDIKPANIMINRKGEPIVMDFGLARLQRPGDAQITQSGQIMGSPAYMSPEQARGATSEIGPASDVYSLGVVLYEMLCGKRPFVGTVTEVLGQILHVPAPPPSTHKTGIDPALEAICMQAMAKDPKDRISSMQEFAETLSDYLKGGSAMTTRANAASVTMDDDVGQEMRMTEMFAALAAEQRSLTKKAVREAAEAGAKAVRPSWPLVLGAAGVIGVLVFLGIWFFARVGTVSVVIQIPIDITDPALTFFLNDKSIEGAELEGKIRLEPGDYTLAVHRNGQPFKEFFFSVPKEVTGPLIVKEIAPPPPPPPPPPGVPASPLDQLDATQIASADRFPWQPSELVAVYGDHRGTHAGEIHSLALSPDGKLLASASQDFTIGLWDANTLHSVGRLAPLLGPVQWIAFTPSGKELLSAEANGVVRVWNVDGRREIGQFTGHKGPVYSVVVLPDGVRALSSGEDASIRLWEITTGKELKKFDKHTNAVWKLCLSADGKRVLSGSHDKTMRFWDLETGEDVVTFENERPGPFQYHAIALSPDGTRAACGWSEGQMNFATMRLFDTVTGKELYRAKGKKHNGHGMGGVQYPGSQVFSPDGSQLLSGAWSPADGNALILWNGKTGDVIRIFGEQSTGATAVIFSHDGKRIYSGTKLGRIRIWEAETGKELLPPTGHESFVSSVDIAPDGLSLLTGGEDLSVRLWNALSGEHEIFRPTNPSTAYSAPWNAYFAPNGKTAILYGGIYTVDHARLWDRETLAELRSFQKDWNEAVYCAAISPDSKRVLAGLHGGLMLWDSERPDLPKRLAGHVGACSSVAFFPEGKQAVTGGADKFIRMWDLNSGDELKRIGPLPGQPRLKVSPDGQWIAASLSGSVRLYKADDMTEFDLGEHVGSAIAFTPDSKTLATGDAGGMIRFWDVATRKKGREINLVHLAGEIHDLDFDSTGRYLASANHNGTAYLLRLEPVPNAPLSNGRGWTRPEGLPLPVAHWNFDEADPTKFIDVTGTIPDGRAGGLRRKAGVIGKAMILDGSEPFVPLGPGHQPKMVFRSEMTLAVWARPRASTSGQVIRRNAGYKLAWQNNDIGFELVLVGRGWSVPIRVYGPATPDRWTHVAGVFAGDRVSLYLDGRLAQSKLVSEDPQVKDNSNLKDVKPPYVMFGVDPGTPNEVGGGYTGLVDELMLFDQALTPEQVEILAASYPGNADPLSSTAQGDNAGFVPLFPRDSLAGWQGRQELWSLKGGVLTGKPTAGSNTALFSPRDYADFELRFQVRLGDDDNSGVQIRSEVLDPAQWKARGPQCDIGNRGGDYWGAVYGEELPGGWLLKPASAPKIKAKDWNDYFIRCVGQHVTIQVNGQTTVDGDIPTMQTTGLLAFQVHRQNQGPVEFRNIEIKELKSPDKATGFVPLFNGKDLSGWKTHPKQPGRWTVENGLLTGKSNTSHHLFSERGDFSDLHLRAEARINEFGNSGLWVRSGFGIGGEGTFGDCPNGYEAQILNQLTQPNHALTGSLWAGNKRIHTFSEPLVKANEWFVLEFIAQRQRLIVKVNGRETANLEHADFKKGHIVLQARSDNRTRFNTVVEFRKIEVKELD